MDFCCFLFVVFCVFFRGEGLFYVSGDDMVILSS